jgi:uncharacterized protein YbjT (DUF2867 family)
VRAARLLERECPHDHALAARRIAGRVARWLDVQPAGWPRHERAAFTRLAPVVALLEGVPRWSPADRRSLAALMRAKGSSQERNVVTRALEHPRFFPELVRLLRG